MEPVQQFCEVKRKFPKFVPSTIIPTAGIQNLKTLELQQVNKLNLIKTYIYIHFKNYFIYILSYFKEFIENAHDSDRVKRMRGLRNANNAYFEACPNPANRFNRQILDKEVIFSTRATVGQKT